MSLWRHMAATRLGPLLTLGCFPFVVGAQAGVVTPVATCDAWLTKALARVEKLPEQKWRDAIIETLPAAPCGSLPVELRRALRSAAEISDAERRDRILATAASEVLGPACSANHLTEDARRIAEKCPLPQQPELNIGHALRDILVVDYLVLNAVATRLVAGNEYDAAAKRLVMDFALSASLRGECVRESRRTPKAHR